jgi:hypothetical protein
MTLDSTDCRGRLKQLPEPDENIQLENRIVIVLGVLILDMTFSHNVATFLNLSVSGSALIELRLIFFFDKMAKLAFIQGKIPSDKPNA